MFTKKVKDLMIPIEQYPTIDKNATMLDAILTLKKAQEKASPELPPFRAVLVLDENKKVIGKVGHFAFLKGLEPKYQDLFDIDKLSRARLSSNFIESLFEKFALWQETPLDLCSTASKIRISEIMQPIAEHVEEEESIAKTIHKIIMWQCLSVLVVRGDEVVGILRTSDIYQAIENYITTECKKINNHER